MNTYRPDVREFAASRGATEDEIATLERGLDALAFLELSRALADEPVEAPAGEPARDDPPGRRPG